MTGEALSYASDALFAAGALDVYFTPILMKKGRPAHLVTILVGEKEKSCVLETLFRETTTFGARFSSWQRATLDREIVQSRCEYGTFRVKIGRYGGAVVSATPEYEDARSIAEKTGLPFRRVYAVLQAEAAKHLGCGGDE